MIYFDAKTGKPIKTFEGLENNEVSCNLSFKDENVFSTSFKNEIRIIDLRTSEN